MSNFNFNLSLQEEGGRKERRSLKIIFALTCPNVDEEEAVEGEREFKSDKINNE